MIEKILIKISYLFTQIILKKRFDFIGKNSVLRLPVQLDHCSSVFIDHDVFIAKYSWIMGNGRSERTIVINSGTTIGRFAHIVGMKSVQIDKSVLIADKVFISDCTHNYMDINTPIKEQDISIVSPVVIGEGSWLGENVCVCGASIGKHCVIGANSVVTNDIPDYCVAVGSPARVVKRYDKNIKEWISL